MTNWQDLTYKLIYLYIKRLFNTTLSIYLQQQMRKDMRQVEFVPLLIRNNAEIFSVRFCNEAKTEFSKMLEIVRQAHDSYIERDKNEILKVLSKMTERGIPEYLFRPEGSINDRVCAIPLDCAKRDINRHGTLRLYCIRISDKLLITGSGGIKTTRTYEQDTLLYDAVIIMQKIDKIILEMENEGICIEDEIYNLTITID